MAAPSNNAIPDLASVLKTLSAYVPPVPNQSGPPLNSAIQVSGQNLYSRAAPISIHETQAQTPQQLDPTANLPDPSTIIVWHAALKYVMKTVAHNETIQSNIRRLIRSQHDHEKQWWEGRIALVAKQEGRAAKKKQINEVLRSVGGVVANDSDGPTPEDDKLELETYDRKVYKALTSMSNALDAELRALGIPFFTTQRRLLVLPSDPPSDPGSSGRLTPDELKNLRLRMLQLLEDLCKD
ncbi:uncharacterized protein PADG_00389 [Paracoccidioides brasiliensis Pb18]|uniref:Uncharacterized protein n=1 Tax=Paracoccidioides brasiliensis (strain Pb18) TaxID=502780 RepID=C1G0J9_PARBD|nr:uncharacterized protein PADG_00389 [Paracoccidioides brasiliensis Pb18]EEH44100.1 hypothetical protein PADG_00389 [Paracoccidioides brasiliensis Pb18]